MVSPVPTSAQYEIWISAPGGHRELFDACRLFESRGDALRTCGAVQDWFHLGAWSDIVFDTLPPDAQDELYALRRGFKADGVDLPLVRVGAKPVATADGRTVVGYCGGDPDDDADADDTDLAPPEVLYHVERGGLTETERLFGRG